METEDQGARLAVAAAALCLCASAGGSSFMGLCEWSGPFPLSVGPWLLLLLLLDGLLRQERLLVACGSVERGEEEEDAAAVECSNAGLAAAPWRPGWTLLIFSEEGPPWLPWLLWLLLLSLPVALLAFPFSKAES